MITFKVKYFVDIRTLTSLKYITLSILYIASNNSDYHVKNYIYPLTIYNLVNPAICVVRGAVRLLWMCMLVYWLEIIRGSPTPNKSIATDFEIWILLISLRFHQILVSSLHTITITVWGWVHPWSWLFVYNLHRITKNQHILVNKHMSYTKIDIATEYLASVPQWNIFYPLAIFVLKIIHQTLPYT